MPFVHSDTKPPSAVSFDFYEDPTPLNESSGVQMAASRLRLLGTRQNTTTYMFTTMTRWTLSTISLPEYLSRF